MFLWLILCIVVNAFKKSTFIRRNVYDARRRLDNGRNILITEAEDARNHLLCFPRFKLNTDFFTLDQNIFEVLVLLLDNLLRLHIKDKATEQNMLIKLEVIIYSLYLFSIFVKLFY